MKINDIDIKENVLLKPFNTYKIEGTSKYLIEIKTIEELIASIKYLKDNNIKYFIIGAGSNIIIDDYFDGAIIKLSGLNYINIKENILEVAAGTMMPSLACAAINNNLEGLEWAINIPGTVGGSIVGNAGAYNCEIFDNLISIKILDENLNVVDLDAKKIKHSYRDTELKNKNIIVLEATFILEYGQKEEMLEKVEDRRLRRLASQPLDMPSAGSVFRNPPNLSAGKLIEDAGLKGVSIGGATVSTKHANFIVNTKGATSKDIKNLIKLIHDTVLEKFGIALELEQQIIDWK